ncbi:DUF3892 domain-containing protein [Paenibacillus xerothermodurans]|uniref:DUF3892 domain-containing protein n=1 Tax=Paenibacillus xerothermodurans TaxID=1977292 RepID=A0A2W1NF45_PAEXE|nr:DUF3892 domain-containing protein [Paenibacillus xerothermodurans]PZE21681.1 hypothetical protein CBW46_004475 [Paenibacillus xerothermodurans]
MDGVNQNDDRERHQVFNQLRPRDQVQSRNQNNPQYNKRERVVAARTTPDGNVVAVRLESGRELNFDEALAETKFNHITGVHVFNMDGRDLLRPDQRQDMDQLPSF